MKPRYNPRIFLSLFFVGLAVYALIEARHWPFNVRLFPTLAASGLLVFSLLQAARDSILPARAAGYVMDFSFAEGMDPRVARRRMVNAIAWILGFALSVWLVGFYVAIPAMVLLYMRVQGKESWVLSGTLAAVAFFFFYFLFDVMLHILLPEPKLFALFS